MKKIIVFGILVLILGGFVSAQGKDTLKAPDRVDSLENKIEKLETELFDKSIEGINRSISHVSILAAIMGVVILILGALGGYAVVRTHGVERELREDIREMRSLVDRECERAQNLADKMRQETEKVSKLREETESAYNKMVKMVEKAKSILEDTTKQKEASEKAAKRSEVVKYLIEANALREKGELQMAIETCRKAINLDPKSGQAYNNLAAYLNDLGKKEANQNLLLESIKKSQEALKYLSESNYDLPYYNWGTALLNLADLKKDTSLYDKSFEKYALAVKYKEDYHEAYSNWGAALAGYGKLKREKQRFRDALEKIERAIEIRKNFAPAWFNKACSHSLLKEKDKALESLKRAIELDPKNKEDAKKDKDFEWLWKDEKFKKLVE